MTWGYDPTIELVEAGNSGTEWHSRLVTAAGGQLTGMARGYDSGMKNPLDAITEKIEEIKEDVQVKVQIWIMTEMCKFTLGLLSTLDHNNATKYNDLHDQL